MEGFAERIRRLLTEENPALPDFEGARLARERDYRRRDPSEGLAAFARALRAKAIRYGYQESDERAATFTVTAL